MSIFESLKVTLPWNKFINSSVSNKWESRYQSRKWYVKWKKQKKNSKIFSPLPVAYVNIKKKINLTRKLWQTSWTPLCSINFEDILKFPDFDVAFDEELCKVQQSFSTYAEDTEYAGILDGQNIIFQSWT